MEMLLMKIDYSDANIAEFQEQIDGFFIAYVE
jgi:hypothetical protein